MSDVTVSFQPDNKTTIAHSGQTLLEIAAQVAAGVDDGAQAEGPVPRHLYLRPGVRQVTLLPYHGLGVHKAERLGRSSRLGGVTTPSDQHLEALAERLEALCRELLGWLSSRREPGVPRQTWIEGRTPD